MGIPDHLTCLLRNLYAGQEATVRTGHETTDWFHIGKGVHQGCILSPYLLNFYVAYIIGEGNGNPLQCSCMENPRDGGAWCAAVSGVAQSRTRLKQLSSKDEMGIPEHLTCPLRNLYAGQEATVRTGHRTTDWFQIGKGVHQGCILSSCLFFVCVCSPS